MGWIELAILAAIAPWFVFPQTNVTPWLMWIPVGLWGLRWASTGQVTRVSSLNPPLLGILIMVGVSQIASYDAVHSFPKTVAVFYGVVVVNALGNHLRGRRAIRWFVSALVLTGLALAAVSLLGTRWPGDAKLPSWGTGLAAVYDRLPALIKGLPRADRGFSSNQVGGTLAFLVPLQAAVWLYAPRKTFRRVLWRFLMGATLAVTASVLLLTLSRTAIASVTISLWGLFLLSGREATRTSKIALAIALILATLIVISLGMTFVDDKGWNDSLSLDGRIEIWHRAWRVLVDHPLTGIGFDNLPAIVHVRYPMFLISPQTDFAHAHNLFLQVALDLGIPGGIAFVALLLNVAYLLVLSYRGSEQALYKATALGLLLGLVAHILFGVLDAIALGQKPGILLWLYIGLADVLHATVSTEQKAGDSAH